MRQIISTLYLFLIATGLNAQMAVYRDTLPVYESGTRLLSPWAGGLNYSAFSQIDLNFDGKNDIVAFDKVCNSGGKLRAFLNIGSPGIAKYKHSPEYQDKLPSLIEWALFFDYDLDGRSDIFTYTLSLIHI